MLAVVIAVVLCHLQQTVGIGIAPGNEVVVLIVDLEEDLQDGQEDGKGKDIEQCRQYVHAQRPGNVPFVAGKIFAHYPIKVLHL